MIQNQEAIRRRATDLLDEVGITTSPVKPEEIAQAKSIRLEIEARFPAGVYGALYRDGSQFGIVVSAACHGEGHRRFTIAHELGHYHLDGHVERMFTDGATQVLSQGGHFRTQRDPHEREADWFASELLMPTPWAEPRIKTLHPTFGGLDDLSNEFGTSLTCAAIRFAELTDEAVAMVVSFDRQIEWVAFSHRLRDHRWSRKAWKREFIPTGSATDRLAQAASRVRAGDSEADEGLLCTWFPEAPAMTIAEEEAIGLGAYGRVLTLLSAPKLPTPEEIEEEEQEHTWRERDWRDAVRGYSLD
jgi:Zn-dependent peptidase ImmA (M78 family)